MKNFENVLICTDLDGTLLGDDHLVSKENREAIEYFKSEGGYFTFVTGRPPVIAGGIYDTIAPNAPVGCFHGGAIYDFKAKEYRWCELMSLDIYDLLDDVCDNVADLGFQVNTTGPIYFCAENAATENFRKITGAPKIICHHREVPDPVVKIVFCGDEKNIADVAAYVRSHPLASNFDLLKADSTLFEIIVKGTHKGKAIPQITAALGISNEKTIAVGDYDNDVGMLREAKVGIAVANASPAARAAADRMTVSNREHAIAKIIYELEEGRIF